MPADPNRVRDIFLDAVELSPEERSGFLADACEGDAELRAEVDRLLVANADPNSILEPPSPTPAHAASTSVPSHPGTVDLPGGRSATDAFDPDAPPASPAIVTGEHLPDGTTEAFAHNDPDATKAAASASAVPAPCAARIPSGEGIGTVIAGRYTLLEVLGEGGMGTVYRAEQTQPVKRQVALKLIKIGMDSRAVLARFDAERQALALMDHPNIARVYDGGTTATGQPFFVMELVSGVPITDYCDRQRLSVRARLELFVAVCQAVQHAHQKGIIHRDLKPGNVMVTEVDGRPTPKVIDFGVAKATDFKLTDQSLADTGAIVGTPTYMSPEQADPSSMDIDTRTDIYALGVILYELLVGSPPLDARQFKQGAILEMLRMVREVDPPRPSTKVSSAEALPSIAASRDVEPAQLKRALKGDLDWIVMKALEKDRTRRYDTAIGFAADVLRHLAYEPVLAAPPSARYRLSKFVRKYKKPLAIAAAFVVLLVVGLVLSTVLAVWATSAEREANRQRSASDDAKREALEAKTEAEKQRDEARLSAYASGMGLAQRAWEENNVVRARELLEEVPKEAAGRELRGFEWYYLSRLCHSEALTLKTPEGHYYGVWSPDGQRLASRGDDNTVKIWDSATGKELFSLKHGGWVRSVAFSPDGQRLASGSQDKTVKIWDSATGKELFSLKQAGPVESVSFSPDGRRLASGSNVSTAETVGKMKFRTDVSTVKIWDSATGKELVPLTVRGSLWGSRVTFSPDGQRLASSGTMDGTLKIWDSVTSKELFSLKGFDWVYLVAFSPDGQRLASVGRQRTSVGGEIVVKMWDSVTGKELFALKGHAAQVTSVAFSPDGQRLASGSWDQTVKMWNSVTGKELFSLKHDGWVNSVAFSPDGQRLASGSHDKTVRIWDSATGTELASLKGHAGPVQSVAFSPDGQRLASGSFDNTLKIWDRDTGKELFSLKDLRVSSVAFSPDGRRLALASDNTLKIWDRDTGKMSSLKGHTDRVFSVAFSPDGQRLASAGGEPGKPSELKIWDSMTGKELLSLKGHTDRVFSVAFSPDGQRLASGSQDKTVKIWDSATGKELFALKGHAGLVSSVAFSPDGQRLASGSDDNTVKIWDSATGKELFALKGHAGPVRSVAFSPDGQRLASLESFDNTVKIWDSVTGKELVMLKGHADPVTSVAFSPDGQRLASGSDDKTVKIWDSATGKELFSLKHGGWVQSVAFSPDGQCLASVGGGVFAIWETAVSPAMQQRREANMQQRVEANGVVADLFKQVGFRADVLERLRTAPGLSPAVRREALAAAQSHAENAVELNNFVWELVKLPGRPLAEYQKALRFNEGAWQLVHTEGRLLGIYLNTEGVAYYRVGNYEKALETLLRSDSDPISQKRWKGSCPADLAFLAMTQQRLGHAKEAQAELQRLRERMKEPRWAQDAEAQGFLREAEALLANQKTPGGK